MTTATDTTRDRILDVLRGFIDGDLLDAATDLLAELDYESDLTLELSGEVDEFIDQLPAINPGTQTEMRFREQVDSIKIIHQMTDNEIGSSASMQGILMDNDGTFDKGHNRSFIFIAVQLKGDVYSRGQYAEFTRETNKRFASPCVVVFKTSANLVTLAFVNRREHKRDKERDVLGNVSLIRQIEAADPHRAHLDILRELSLTNMVKWIRANDKPRNFDGLLAAWLAKLDTQELNKSFYRELFDWFERTVDESRFPQNQAVTIPSEEHVIRLITRLLFVWFIKEKRLVHDHLFNEKKVSKFLKHYDRNQGDSYYRVVLQNLFFATLNTPIDRRTFSSVKQRTHRVFDRYRYRQEMSDPDGLRALFAETPFINGGLFDCLDTEKSTRDGGYRIDCFSDNVVRKGTLEYDELSIPNRLFFDDEGIIPLFNRYKFTVEENTPAEQEVALDPELLGTVFENLLAAINPETKESARKLSGSYYTPRRIVEYMVDEALVESLTDKVKPMDDDRGFLRDRVRYLLDYNDAFDDGAELFEPAEISQLVKSIATLKILDPAVGSGAFPMGVLHKLTLALSRLDRHNERWEILQKDLAIQQARKAFEESEQQQRDERLQEISDTFERYRESNFGRKLYLIQNSIFGVDVQSIACQIAKLRFFISLAIEQQPDSSKTNFGIKPLPNLETRFVAANTLLGLGLGSQIPLGGQNNVTELNNLLRKNRERHFHAGTRREKQRIQHEDKRLRNLLADELKRAGVSETDAGEIAKWDPYDQNTDAKWFDAAYMFDVDAGFDIVIGNPPYVRADSGETHLELRRKIEADDRYQTLWEKWDLYVAFIEKGYRLLKSGGFVTMIVSDAYCHAKYAQKSQNWFINNSRIIQLDFFGKVRIFEAAVRNITFLFQKTNGRQHTPIRKVHDPDIGIVKFLNSEEQRNLTHRVFFPEDSDVPLFSTSSLTLKEICYVSKGMVVHANEKKARGAFGLNDVVSDSFSPTHTKPFVEGKHIGRWTRNTKKWLEWGTKRAPSLFSRPTFTERYEVAQKLISVDMAAGTDKLRVAYDDEQLYHNHSAWSFVLWNHLAGVRNRSIKRQARYRDEKSRNSITLDRSQLERNSNAFDIKFILGIMNSTPAREFLRSNRRSNIHLYPDDWKELPIPVVSREKQKPVIESVDAILAAKRADPDSDISHFEDKIDELVHHLYGLTDEETATVEQQL